MNSARSGSPFSSSQSAKMRRTASSSGASQIERRKAALWSIAKLRANVCGFNSWGRHLACQTAGRQDACPTTVWNSWLLRRAFHPWTEAIAQLSPALGANRISGQIEAAQVRPRHAEEHLRGAVAQVVAGEVERVQAGQMTRRREGPGARRPHLIARQI